jgi:ribosomal protein L37AE/L43A
MRKEKTCEACPSHRDLKATTAGLILCPKCRKSFANKGRIKITKGILFIQL